MLRCTISCASLFADTVRQKGKPLTPCPSPACGHSSAPSYALLWLQRPNPTQPNPYQLPPSTPVGTPRAREASAWSRAAAPHQSQSPAGGG